MSKSVLAALILALLALPAAAQIVKVTQTDGKVVQGELLGYENGKYRVRLSGGVVDEIEERRVQDIVLISPTGERGPARESGALEAARAAFERNDLDLALQKVSEAMRTLDDDRSQMAGLTARISAAYLERLLEQKDAARFSEGLRQVVPTLTPETRKELLQKMAERLADLHRSAPDSAFAVALGDALAVADEGTIPEELRGSLADLFLERAQAQRDHKDYAAALTLLRGALRVDPKRRDALKGLLGEVALARAKALLEKGDAGGAVLAAREASQLDPDSVPAKDFVGEAEFAAIRQKADSESGGSELLQALRKFLEGSRKADERDWAEKAIARAASAPSPQSTQLFQYYPVKAGRFMLYRRGDGEFTERVHTDSVVREGEALRLFTSVKETYRDFCSSKVLFDGDR